MTGRIKNIEKLEASITGSLKTPGGTRYSDSRAPNVLIALIRALNTRVCSEWDPLNLSPLSSSGPRIPAGGRPDTRDYNVDIHNVQSY